MQRTLPRELLSKNPRYIILLKFEDRESFREKLKNLYRRQKIKLFKAPLRHVKNLSLICWPVFETEIHVCAKNRDQTWSSRKGVIYLFFGNVVAFLQLKLSCDLSNSMASGLCRKTEYQRFF